MTTPKTVSDFTIRSANQTLPLVKMIVQDIVELREQVSETQVRLDYLADGRSDENQDEYGKELAAIQLVTELQCNQIDQWIEELTELRLSTHEVDLGFVDFPALRDDQHVCLCWQLGEKEVAYWHRTDEKCSQRQPVDLPLIRQSGEQNFSSHA